MAADRRRLRRRDPTDLDRSVSYAEISRDRSRPRPAHQRLEPLTISDFLPRHGIRTNTAPQRP
eukprot:11154745-Lingulodinium_polyedra.AAC.1